jgi:hypothetical protein
MIYATGIFNVSGHLITSFLTLEEFVRLISTSGRWMDEDKEIVEMFGQQPWIHHDEVLNCWSKLLWFAKRGARLRYSPWLQRGLWGIPYGVWAQSICDCPICRTYLMARVKRGEIVEMCEYSEQRHYMVRDARLQVANTFLTRLAYVTAIRRRNNQYAPGVWNGLSVVSENIRAYGGYQATWANDEHDFSEEEVGFPALYWHPNPLPAFEWVNGRMTNFRNSEDVLIEFHPDGHHGIGHDEEPL